jgi:hypothetical protein
MKSIFTLVAYELMSHKILSGIRLKYLVNKINTWLGRTMDAIFQELIGWAIIASWGALIFAAVAPLPKKKK